MIMAIFITEVTTQSGKSNIKQRSNNLTVYCSRNNSKPTNIKIVYKFMISVFPPIILSATYGCCRFVARVKLPVTAELAAIAGEFWGPVWQTRTHPIAEDSTPGQRNMG